MVTSVLGAQQEPTNPADSFSFYPGFSWVAGRTLNAVTRMFSEHCFHPSPPVSRFLHHPLQHNTVLRRGPRRPSLGAVRAGISEGRGVWPAEGGEGQGKQKGSLKSQVLWMGKIKIGTESGKRSVTTTEGCSDGISLHWLRVCAPPGKSRWGGCTPEIRVLSAFLSVPGCQPRASLACEAFWWGRGIAYWGHTAFTKHPWLEWQLKYFGVKQNFKDLGEFHPYYSTFLPTLGVG